MYLQHHWAKARQNPTDIHLLEHHLADVGTCFEALLEQPLIRRRLANAGGYDDLCGAAIARLSLFAAMHDIGKINTKFQTQIWRNIDLPHGTEGWPGGTGRPGHTDDLVPVINWQDETTAKWFFTALGIEEMMDWDADEGSTVSGLLVATFSHHGRPLRLEGGRSRNPEIWRDFGDLNPRASAERIGDMLRDWFPLAFAADAPALPSPPAFQHMFLGLCTLADWIGSNERWFEFVDTPQGDYFHIARKNAKRAMTDIGLNISDQRRVFLQEVMPSFGALFRADEDEVAKTPNAIQRASSQDIPLHEPVVIMESETGSGKTEAALWRFARMYEKGLVDGIYFALPTRAAAVQIHGRVRRFVANLLDGQDSPPVVLAVPGYNIDSDADSTWLQEYDDHAAGEHHHGRPWASENPKRYLAAQIAVGTIDQAMLGALKVRHAHMRAACLARNLLVVDEVHASDTYMRRILEAVLEAHVGAGGYALLMSATLGSDARRRLLSTGKMAAEYPTLSLDAAIHTPYPAISIQGDQDECVKGVEGNGKTKTVRIWTMPKMADFDTVAETAMKAASAGAKVLVVRNTVAVAVETQRALERLAGESEKGLLFRCNGVPTLHHGRYAAHDRRLLDNAVESVLGKDAQRDAGRVVVGTQTLEQSLDIDADLLITDLCPMDVLLQRIGRLHRHDRDGRAADYRVPKCIVLTAADADLSPLLTGGEYSNGLGPRGYVYSDLRVLQATLRLINECGEWEIPAMNRELVERATHPDALEAIVAELGAKWRTHANEVDGEHLADGLTAQGVLVRRDKSFYTDNRDVLFLSDEEKIRTRLGDDRVEIVLAEPQDSPFGQTRVINKLAVSIRWVGNVEVPESVGVRAIRGGFVFAIGSRNFRYDRMGLHRG